MGYIIVIEGTDGCGKQTQTKALVENLINQGFKVRTCSFPNYDSPSAAPVKMYLGGEFGNANSMTPKQASVLYAVDRLCTYKKDLEEFYLSGGIVVLDRYVQSNMLHQAGKISDKLQVDEYLEWLDSLEFGDLGLPRADKVIFLDMPIEASRKLMIERGIHKSCTQKDVHEEDPEHMIKAYNSGKYVSKKFGWTTIPCVDESGNIKTIDEISSLVLNDVMKDLKM